MTATAPHGGDGRDEARLSDPTMWRRWQPLALTVAVGILLSLLPHLVARVETGSFDWVADGDELSLYLAVSAKLYHGDAYRLSDPVSRRRDPTAYPWTQLAPGILTARSLGTGPLSVSLIWRFLAGATTALAWYMLFFYWSRNGWLAAAGAIFLMSAGDLLTARLFF